MYGPPVAERVEYDVAVNLKLSAKGSVAGRVAKEARDVERSHKRELEAARRAREKWWGGARKGTTGGLDTLTGGLAGAFKSVGAGPAIEWAKTAAAAAGVVFAGAFGYAAGKGIVGGVQENVSAESSQNRIGTTLQLFDFNAAAGAANQYTRNLQDATWYTKELVRIADAAPGDIGQVEELFQGMLPGMASITQEAKRITSLTQKATLLSAVLDNRFKMVGEQSSRMLTGGAGAEMDTWRLLQAPILEAGRAMGVFSKSQGLGEKLTMAFNKLDPEKRLAVFEKGLERLGDEVAQQYAGSWEGITSQAISSGKALRRVLGKETFDEIKSGLKAITQDGGPLDAKGPQYRSLREFMGVLGEGFGSATKRGMDYALRATNYVADHWQQIVMSAQAAAHYLVSGAKVAAGLSAARMGAGLGLGVAGFGLDAVRGVGSAVAGIASMGSAALVAAPALLAAGAAAAGLGIVALGAGLMFGGVVTYLVSNLDELGSALRSGAVDLQPLLTAIDDLGAKFYALGAYLLGGTDAATGFQGAVDIATGVVEGVTTAFGGLLDATAWVIEAFASLVDFVKGLNPFSNDRITTAGGALGAVFNPLGGGAAGLFGAVVRGEVAAAANNTPESSGVADQARELADSIRGAAEAFRNAKADPFNAKIPSLSDALYNRLYPMGPEAPPPGGNANNKKPPKVDAKVTIYNQMNLREMDPNAVVAAFNRITAQKVAVPLQAALRRAQVG